MRQRRIVYVIPCGAKKVDKPTKAKDLYVGSMFKQALRAAESQGDGEVLILSALHGLLHPDAIIEPYNLKMGDKGSVGVADLIRDVRRFDLDDEEVDVYSMLPSAYDKVLDKALRYYDKYTIPVYEATGGIGEQKRVCRVMNDSVKCIQSALADAVAALED